MKLGIRSALLAVVLLAITAAPVWAAPPLQDGGSFDKLGEIIGALGLFAAMMAVLALGAEVVIDTLKFFVGLKRKPTALEALDQLGDKLPGQLRELGADSRAIAQLADMTEGMRAALAPLKKPVEFTEAVRNGEFATAIDLGQQLAARVGQDPAALRASFVEALGSGIAMFGRKLALDGEVVDRLRAELVNAARDFDADTAATQALEWLHEYAPEIGDAWLRGNAQVLAEQGLEQGRDALLQRFDREVRPQLAGIGLDAAAVNTLRGQIEQGLLQLTGHLHLDAMTQLLEGVELRRYQIQSPLRKLWRRLRNSSFPSELDFVPSNVRVGKLLEWLERLWNYLLGRTPESGDLNAPQPVEALTPTNVARRLLELDSFHKDEEASRLRVLRLISAVVGIYLAYLLQVNAVDILAGATESFQSLARINEVVNTQLVLHWLNPPLLLKLFPGRVFVQVGAGMELNAGILLSGLAASAGSAFWHDQLERLQVAKKAATQVQKAVETVRGIQNA